jgi:hypothetical protein
MIPWPKKTGVPEDKIHMVQRILYYSTIQLSKISVQKPEGQNPEPRRVLDLISTSYRTHVLNFAFKIS